MLYAIVVVLLLIADQGLKYWVTVHVALNEGRHVLIPHVLDIMNIHNYGIAFSWLQNVPSWVFAIIAAIFAAVVIVALKRGMIHGKFGRWMAVIALAGAIGNLIDRVLSGYVVDMLAFAFWKSFPVFNLADACLVVGGIAFCLYVIFHKDPGEEATEQPQRKRSSKRRPAAKAPAGPSAFGAAVAEKRAALHKSVEARQRKAAEARRAAAEERRAVRAQEAAEAAAAKPAVAEDDPFAAWDRAVSEQDARAKADAERRAEREAKLRAEREAKKRAAEAEVAKTRRIAAATDKDASEKAAPKPVADSTPTRRVASKKIEEMAAKIAPKKPAAPAPKPVVSETPAEEEVSYNLEDILAEFADL